MAAIQRQPEIIVGTIHSVKGGEADVVYLLPDLSVAAVRQAEEGDEDSITRTFYVGMTRAKERLVLCGQSQKYGVEW